MNEKKGESISNFNDMSFLFNFLSANFLYTRPKILTSTGFPIRQCKRNGSEDILYYLKDIDTSQIDNL